MTDTFPFSFDSETEPPSRVRRPSKKPTASVIAVWVLSIILAIVLALFFVASGFLDLGTKTLASDSTIGHTYSSKLAWGTNQLNGGVKTLSGGLGTLASGTQEYATITQEAATGVQSTVTDAQLLSSKVGLLSNAVNEFYLALENGGVPQAGDPSLLTVANGVNTGVSGLTDQVNNIGTLLSSNSSVSVAAGSTQYNGPGLGLLATGLNEIVNASPDQNGTVANTLIHQILFALAEISPSAPGGASASALMSSIQASPTTTPFDVCITDVGKLPAATQSALNGANPTTIDGQTQGAFLFACAAPDAAYAMSQALPLVSNAITSPTSQNDIALLKEGSSGLATGVSTVTSTVGTLNGAVQLLNSKVALLPGGMTTLANGLQQLATGASTISSYVNLASNGTGKLVEGTGIVNMGAQKFNDEMASVQSISSQLHQGTDAAGPIRLGIPVAIGALVIILLTVLTRVLIRRRKSREALVEAVE